MNGASFAWISAFGGFIRRQAERGGVQAGVRGPESFDEAFQAGVVYDTGEVRFADEKDVGRKT